MALCENNTSHNCEERAEKRQATHNAPYHHVGSGLDNVYLIGITYYVCPDCGTQAAEIPAMKSLFEALGRTIIEKRSRITGPELRFLRKRLAKKAVEFAPMISLTPETLSSLENKAAPIDPSRDKLVRLVFRGLSGDKQLRHVFDKGREFERWLASISGDGREERIYARRLRNNQWKVDVEALAA